MRLDKDFIRCGGEFRWYEHPDQLITLETLRATFEGRGCYIVGKGPSLDNLSRSNFDSHTCPIICINESIHKVESLGLPNPIFAIQQDSKLHATCCPSHGTLLVSTHAADAYAGFDKKYIFNPVAFKYTAGSLTVEIAVAICKKLGTREFRMLCFDAHQTGSTEYAKVIGYLPNQGGSVGRFLNHAKIMDGILDGESVEFLTPAAHVLASEHTPSLQPTRQPEHREHRDEEHSEDSPDTLGSS